MDPKAEFKQDCSMYHFLWMHNPIQILLYWYKLYGYGGAWDTLGKV